MLRRRPVVTVTSFAPVNVVPAAPTAAKAGARAWTRGRTATLVALSVALLSLILVPRLTNLDALATPDERFWVARSANFYQALATGNLTDTYQFVHPGVPIMWMGALGYSLTIPDLADLTGGQVGVNNRELQGILTRAGYSRIDVLVNLRQALTVASALVLIAVFLCLAQIVPAWQAALAIAFLALDPMHIGFSRLLHLDGISTNLLLLSIIAYCWYLEKESRLALVISGIAAGLACLTRSANFILGPLVALIAGAYLLRPPAEERAAVALRRKRLNRERLLWTAVAGVTAFVCWPAMWVAPIGTLAKMMGGGVGLAAEPHIRQVLFLGDVTGGNPGLAYYPVILAYRLSPVTLIGLIVAVIAAFRPGDLGRDFPMRLAKGLALFAVTYAAILMITPKKLDRYLLPSIAALDLIAALAWIALALWAGRRLSGSNPARSRLLLGGTVTIMLLVQAGLAANARPYFIDAASPLLGGERGARQQFSFNWGEGGKPVAESLMTIDGIEDATVSGGLWPQTIDVYLPFNIADAIYTTDLRGAGQWLVTDYIVLTYPEVQRELYPAPLREWFETHQPVRTVDDDLGIYARIYDIRAEPLPEVFRGPESGVVDWDGAAKMIGVAQIDEPKPACCSTSTSTTSNPAPSSRSARN